MEDIFNTQLPNINIIFLNCLGLKQFSIQNSNFLAVFTEPTTYL